MIETKFQSSVMLLLVTKWFFFIHYTHFLYSEKIDLMLIIPPPSDTAPRWWSQYRAPGWHCLNGPQCVRYLYKPVNCMHINCNFYHKIVRNKWFNLPTFSRSSSFLVSNRIYLYIFCMYWIVYVYPIEKAYGRKSFDPWMKLALKVFKYKRALFQM